MATNRRQSPRLTRMVYNYGIYENYHKQLKNIVIMIAKEYATAYNLYKKNEKKIVITEDSVVDDLFNLFKRKSKEIKTKIDSRMTKVVNGFINKIDKTSFASFEKELSDKYNLKAKMNVREHKEIKKSLIFENVNLIKELSDDYQKKISNAIYRSLARGDDVSKLSEILQKEYGIAERRARTIARDQTHKATSNLMMHTYKINGIKEAIWHHNTNTLTARISHKKFNEKVFDIFEGAYIDGEYIQPGELVNCSCTCTPLMPTETAEVGKEYRSK